MTRIPSAAYPPAIEIIVPARNEAGRLPAGLSALCGKAATLPLRTAILVVDSASTDSTADLVRRWPAGPVPVGLLHCDRPGKGVAVRAGLLATQAPFVGFCDADMATDLSALDVAISFLAAGHSLVIGSRGLSGSVVEARSSALRGAGAALFKAMAQLDSPGNRGYTVRVQVLLRPAGAGGGRAAADGRVRLRRGIAGDLPAPGRDGDRDPGQLARHRGLHILGPPPLGRRVP